MRLCATDETLARCTKPRSFNDVPEQAAHKSRKAALASGLSLQSVSGTYLVWTVAPVAFFSVTMNCTRRFF